MPTTDPFSIFKDLGVISPEEIIHWLPHSLNVFYIENYIANKIYYPQTIPQTKEDLALELAILRVLLSKTTQFYSQKESKFIIPESVVNYFPSLSQVIWAYLDVYPAKGVIKVVTKNQKLHILGTVIVPEITKKEGLVELLVEKKKYSIKLGDLTVIPCLSSRCDINFFSENAKILGKNEEAIEVFGGNLGLVIDTRGKK